MKIEIRSRLSGKTTEHVAWLNEETDEDRVLLVQSNRVAQWIQNEHFLTARQVMCWKGPDLHRRLVGRRPVFRIEEGQDLVSDLVARYLNAPVEVLQLCADHVEIGA